jgi:hypothetical protein
MTDRTLDWSGAMSGMAEWNRGSIWRMIPQSVGVFVSAGGCGLVAETITA